MKNKGQISIATTAIMAGATILASIIAGWVSAGTKVNIIDTKVQVVEERENNHYAETQKKLDSIDKKLDEILRMRNK